MAGSIFDMLLHLDKYLSILIQNYGIFVYFFLFIIIFIETGLVFTPFLPGDSLLFVAGTFAGAGALDVYILLFILSLAAILGDTCNYWLGSFFGGKVFSRFIKKEHLERTKKFYEKHGKKTIVLARFVPIIRTFAPFVAGIGKMEYFTFLSYNVIGAIAWVTLFTLGGYFFGNIPLIKEHLGVVSIIVIVISFIPVILEYLRHRKKTA